MSRPCLLHRSLILIVSVVITINCAPDAPFKFKMTMVPEQLNDGWEIATPGEVNISQAALDQIYGDFISEDRYFNAISLLVVIDGKLVFEAYSRSITDRDHIGHIQSATKSITSLAFGQVLAADYIDSLEQTLYSIIPDKFPSDVQKRSITLDHLLTMTSGLAFDNDDFSVEIYANKPEDPVRYILNKPLYAYPGGSYYYRDCDPHLVSYAIQRLTGKTEEQWVRENLLDPIGITDYYWGHDHTGVTMGAHGLHLKPRDMARIGQLVLDNGRWDGQQIVDSAWVETSTRVHMQTDWRSEPYVYHYGYYWWIIPRWQAFTAWGNGGNFIFVVPERSMVVVMTSMPDVDDDTVGTQLDDFEQLIMPLLQG